MPKSFRVCYWENTKKLGRLVGGIDDNWYRESYLPDPLLWRGAPLVNERAGLKTIYEFLELVLPDSSHDGVTCVNRYESSEELGSGRCLIVRKRTGMILTTEHDERFIGRTQAKRLAKLLPHPAGVFL